MTDALIEKATTNIDRDLTELVDAIVAAVDIDRSWEIDRLQEALEPFGAAGMFAAELRLSGTGSVGELCCCEEWL